VQYNDCLTNDSLGIDGLIATGHVDAYAYCYRHRSAVGTDLAGANLLSNFFCPANRSRQVATGQSKQELFSSVSACAVIAPEVGLDPICHFL
jgi:hypothetical protein